MLNPHQGIGDGCGEMGGLGKGDTSVPLGLRILKFLGKGPGFLLKGNLLPMSLLGVGLLLLRLVPDGDPTKSMSASST